MPGNRRNSPLLSIAAVAICLALSIPGHSLAFSFSLSKIFGLGSTKPKKTVQAATRDNVLIVRVSDGDTVTASNNEKIRLLGINAPEMSHEGSPPEYYGEEAGKQLSDMVKGKVLTIRTYTGKNDRYGRTLAELILDNGTSVNTAMLERGAAFFLYYKELDQTMQDRFMAAQRRAIEAERGFWPVILKMPGKWVGNKNSRRFHKPGSTYANKTSKKNRIHFSSVREAFIAGYAPAREENIWPEK